MPSTWKDYEKAQSSAHAYALQHHGGVMGARRMEACECEWGNVLS